MKPYAFSTGNDKPWVRNITAQHLFYVSAIILLLSIPISKEKTAWSSLGSSQAGRGLWITSSLQPHS